jgi:uncharacterized protein YpuA (DUF1002 family)
VGDHIEPYGLGDDINTDADRIEELARELHDALFDISRRIEATEGTRRPIRDREGEIADIPDSEYPDLSNASGIIAEVTKDFGPVSDGLAQLADELRSASEAVQAFGD